MMSFILDKLTGATKTAKLRIAIIGQSNFAAEVLELYLDKGYEIVGVFTIPDKNGREDILATTAEQLNIPVKYRHGDAHRPNQTMLLQIEKT